MEMVLTQPNVLTEQPTNEKTSVETTCIYSALAYNVYDGCNK